MNDEERRIEEELRLQKAIAPRITPTDLDDAIDPDVPVQYHVFPGTTTTICLLTLRNGFTVTGESAAVSMENFNEKIGRDVAFNDARDKLWLLLGYGLKERLAAEAAESGLPQ